MDLQTLKKKSKYSPLDLEFLDLAYFIVSNNCLPSNIKKEVLTHRFLDYTNLFHPVLQTNNFTLFKQTWEKLEEILSKRAVIDMLFTKQPSYVGPSFAYIKGKEEDGMKIMTFIFDKMNSADFLKKFYLEDETNKDKEKKIKKIKEHNMFDFILEKFSDSNVIFLLEKAQQKQKKMLFLSNHYVNDDIIHYLEKTKANNEKEDIQKNINVKKQASSKIL